jgi:hypothetical protein
MRRTDGLAAGTDPMPAEGVRLLVGWAVSTAKIVVISQPSKCPPILDVMLDGDRPLDRDLMLDIL